MSGVEPAPNGTMRRTVLVGQSCAAAGARLSNRAVNASASVLIRVSSILIVRLGAGTTWRKRKGAPFEKVKPHHQRSSVAALLADGPWSLLPRQPAGAAQ